MVDHVPYPSPGEPSGHGPEQAVVRHDVPVNIVLHPQQLCPFKCGQVKALYSRPVLYLGLYERPYIIDSVHDEAEGGDGDGVIGLGVVGFDEAG